MGHTVSQKQNQAQQTYAFTGLNDPNVQIVFATYADGQNNLLTVENGQPQVIGENTGFSTEGTNTLLWNPTATQSALTATIFFEGKQVYSKELKPGNYQLDDTNYAKAKFKTSSNS